MPEVNTDPDSREYLPIFLTRERVALELSMSPREVIRLIEAGQLREKWTGSKNSRSRITRESFLAYVESLPDERPTPTT